MGKRPDENDRHAAGEDLDDGSDLQDLGDAPPSRKPPIDYHCTDLGNRDRFVDRHGDDVRYVREWGSWLTWDAAELVWTKDGRATNVRRWCSEVHRAIRDEAALAEAAATKARQEGDSRRGEILDARAAKLWKHWEGSEATSKVTAALSAAEASSRVSIGEVELDANPLLFTGKGWAVDLGVDPPRPRAARREDLVTRRSPVCHHHNAQAPEWERFLLWAMQGDKEMVSYLQRAVGYSLTADVSEQVFFFLHGPMGRNGKSTFLKVIKRLLGSYAVVTPPGLLIESATGGERHPTELMRLVGSRAVIGAEVGSNVRWNEERLKYLTGEDELAARGMGQDFRDFPITWKLWVSANDRPHATGGDRALWRRVRLIPFLAHVAEGEEDRGLGDKLMAELPGILAWAIEGARLWRKDGLGQPDKVAKAVEHYRQSVDQIGQWVEECCELVTDAMTPMRDLYQSYAQWARDQGIKNVLPNFKLGQDLEKRGFANELHGKGNVRHRVGIRLRSSPQGAFDLAASNRGYYDPPF